MSAKWRRVQAWDDRFFPSWAWPAKAVLRAFSSIPLAVTMLSGVSLFAVFASIPIGLIVLGLTWVVYGLTLLVAIGLMGVWGGWFLGGLLPGDRAAGRFALRVILMVGLSTLASWIWSIAAWPALHYDPATGAGLRLFPEFVDRYDEVTLRRLPGFEMTELEFYSWWPMKLMLGIFVVNMVVATVRRIEFTFKNLGVLTVHTGIVIIALGSIYYQGLKQEGDTILIAGAPDDAGVNGPGPVQRVFYDNVRVSLWIDQLQGFGWEQRPLTKVPRYNEYGLHSLTGETVSSLTRRSQLAHNHAHRTLDRVVPDSMFPDESTIDSRLNFRLVGYAPYAEAQTDWIKQDPPVLGDPTPLRMVYLYSDLELDEGQESTEPAFYYALTPTVPSNRVNDNQVVGVEYTIGLDDQRFEDLSREIPGNAPHALIVRIPGADYEELVAPPPGTRVALGDTGWAIEIEQLLPEPPFPIITAGFEGATSPVAVVRIFEPEAVGGETYTRWVYSRFPEIGQDLLDQTLDDGRPVRRDADPKIELVSIDADQLQVLFDEDPETGAVRAIIREPAGDVRVYTDLQAGERLRDVVDKIDFRLGERWTHAEQVEVPRVVPEIDREGDFIGTHDRAMLAVEVTMDGNAEWSRVVWLPFIKYLSLGSFRDELKRTIELPDGTPLNLAFGRLQRRFPGFQLRLVDFEMIAYDHRGAPRDYQSLVRVEPNARAAFDAYTHVTKLNAPLKAPFLWNDERGLAANVTGELVSHLRPDQFKLSQAGWDAEGWRESRELADQGLIPRPRASFTILQVGNNPGIHVIAFGGVLMSIGIPWAFYLKPWLVKREKRALQKLAAQKARAGSETEAKPTPIGAEA